jgi:hypothetical protein
MVIIIKECLVVAGDSFLSEFKNKTETYNVINKVQLSQNAICVYVQWHEQQRGQDLQICEILTFSLMSWLKSVMFSSYLVLCRCS